MARMNKIKLIRPLWAHRDQADKAATSSAGGRDESGPELGQTQAPDPHFRSSLLASMPQTDLPGRVRRIVLRIAILTLIAVMVWLLIDAVANQRIAKDNPLRIMYWLHDYVFLPVKGYTYTYHYPISLIWWSLVATILGLRLLSLVLGWSVVQCLHVCLAWIAVHWTALHPHLITMARWFNLLGFEPSVLKEVAKHERTSAMIRLAALPLPESEEPLSPKAPKKECSAVTHRTRLITGLLTLPRSKVADRLDAAALWHQAFLQVRVHSKGHAEWPSELLSLLTGDILSIAAPILNSQTAAPAQEKSSNPTPGFDRGAAPPPMKRAQPPVALRWLDTAAWRSRWSKVTSDTSKGDHDSAQDREILERRTGFDPVTVMIDLLHLASLNNGNVARQVEQLGVVASLINERSQGLERVAESVETRQSVLDAARSRFEMLALRGRLASIEADIEGIAREIPSQNPSTIGQLSLGIALDLAERAEAPEIAWGHINTIEALAFALELVDPASGEATRDLVGRLSALIGDLPYPEHYRLCARLAELKNRRRKDEWKQSLLQSREADGFALAQTRINSLHHAAGPKVRDRPEPPRRGLRSLKQWVKDHCLQIRRICLIVVITDMILLAAGTVVCFVLSWQDIAAMINRLVDLIK